MSKSLTKIQQNHVNELTDMGYHEKDAIKALEVTMFNVDHAISCLMNPQLFESQSKKYETILEDPYCKEIQALDEQLKEALQKQKEIQKMQSKLSVAQKKNWSVEGEDEYFSICEKFQKACEEYERLYVDRQNKMILIVAMNTMFKHQIKVFFNIFDAPHNYKVGKRHINKNVYGERCGPNDPLRLGTKLKFKTYMENKEDLVAIKKTFPLIFKDEDQGEKYENQTWIFNSKFTLQELRIIFQINRVQLEFEDVNVQNILDTLNYEHLYTGEKTRLSNEIPENISIAVLAATMC